MTSPPTYVDAAEAIRRLRQRGPAVILGNPDSLFVRQLATLWKSWNLDPHIVSSGPNLPTSTEDGVPIHDSIKDRPLWSRVLRVVNPVLRWWERKLPELYLKRYQQRTGYETPSRWESFWVDHFWDSYSRARTALGLKPGFVFGQEAAAYGRATALCRGVPRVVFPWGADIYLSCECSPPIDWMIKSAFRQVDLIVPTSRTAAQHIAERFHVSPDKVAPISWGADLKMFHRVDADARRQLRRRWSIPADATVILNVRRFLPLWGCHTALDACLEIARNNAHIYCVFLGSHERSLIEEAQRKVDKSGLSAQIQLVDRIITLGECAELMQSADLFLSLMSHGDMRSLSVIQAAATGGVPVLSPHPEYESMNSDGFQAHFVPAEDRSAIVAAVNNLIKNPAELERMSRLNENWLKQHEDAEHQMRELLVRIERVSRKYPFSSGK